MSDASYDVVLIGGGHNGLCAAAYLARAGQTVGIFESRHEEAGAVHTSEATVPGYSAFKAIAEDYDLPKIWQRDDRIY